MWILYSNTVRKNKKKCVTRAKIISKSIASRNNHTKWIKLLYHEIPIVTYTGGKAWGYTDNRSVKFPFIHSLHHHIISDWCGYTKIYSAISVKKIHGYKADWNTGRVVNWPIGRKNFSHSKERRWTHRHLEDGSLGSFQWWRYNRQ